MVVYKFPFPLQDSFCFAWYIPLAISVSGAVFALLWRIVLYWNTRALGEYKLDSISKPEQQRHAQHYRSAVMAIIDRQWPEIPSAVASHILSFLAIECTSGAAITAEETSSSLDENGHDNKKPAWTIVYEKEYEVVIRQSLIGKQRIEVVLCVYLILRFFLVLLIWYILIESFVEYTTTTSNENGWMQTCGPKNNERCSAWAKYGMFYHQMLFHPSCKLCIFGVFLFNKYMRLRGDARVKNQNSYTNKCLLYLQYGTALFDGVTFGALALPFVVTHLFVALFAYISTFCMLAVAFGFTLVVIAGFFALVFQGRVIDQDLDEDAAKILLLYAFVFFGYAYAINGGIGITCLYDGHTWVDCFKYAFFGEYCASSSSSTAYGGGGGGEVQPFVMDWNNWKSVVLFTGWIIA